MELDGGKKRSTVQVSSRRLSKAVVDLPNLESGGTFSRFSRVFNGAWHSSPSLQKSLVHHDVVDSKTRTHIYSRFYRLRTSRMVRHWWPGHK